MFKVDYLILLMIVKIWRLPSLSELTPIMFNSLRLTGFQFYLSSFNLKMFFIFLKIATRFIVLSIRIYDYQKL